MDYSLIISNISQHIKFSSAGPDLFTSLSEPFSVSKKEYFLRTGDIYRYDYFVNKACLKVCYTDEKGKNNFLPAGT